MSDPEFDDRESGVYDARGDTRGLFQNKPLDKKQSPVLNIDRETAHEALLSAVVKVAANLNTIAYSVRREQLAGLLAPLKITDDQLDDMRDEMMEGKTLSASKLPKPVDFDDVIVDQPKSDHLVVLVGVATSHCTWSRNFPDAHIVAHNSNQPYGLFCRAVPKHIKKLTMVSSLHGSAFNAAQAFRICQDLNGLETDFKDLDRVPKDPPKPSQGAVKQAQAVLDRAGLN